VIKLKEITKYYYGDNSVAVGLRNVNLEFKKGEFVAITGKSGSGKSTLINVISGMDTYEEGEMYFKGMETSYYDHKDWELYRKNKISFVYQSYNLIDSYTALQNVEAVLMVCEDEDSKLSKAERRKRAMEALDRVGLSKQANNKATHLSSGQKQRLGIARALAKNTDVIIADEPTGNLDVENGKAIMSILHELSKEKLIIVVTHNYELAEPYATRKIRLFDGEVVEDIKRDKELYKDKDFQSDFDISVVEEDREIKNTFKTAMHFVKMNRFAQPHRTFFIFMFVLLSAVASVIFYGYFLSQLDDTKTKKINEEIFSNRDDKRIIVKKLDGKEFTSKDFDIIKGITYVEQVDKYDGANDANYFYKEGVDYKITYEVTDNKKYVDIELLKFDKFIKSYTCIDKEDLSSGEMPKEYNEVVLYSTDKSMIGKKVKIYLRNNAWKQDYYDGKEFVVSGLLKEKSSQIYFSEELSKEYASNAGKVNAILTYNINQIIDYKEDRESDELMKERRYTMNIVIGMDLKNNEVLLSEIITKNLAEDGLEKTDRIVYEKLQAAALLDELSVNVNLEKASMSSERVLALSKEQFYKLVGDYENKQMSVYIKNFAFTDRVIDSLTKEGYEAISALRVSTTNYDDKLTEKRLLAIIISLSVLVVVFALEILVVYALMKLKRADFVILKSLGMKAKMAGEMNYYELITTSIFASILAIIGLYIVAMNNVLFISEIMLYYKASDYIIIVLIGVVMSIITAKLYNRYLRKTFRLTALRNN